MPDAAMDTLEATPPVAPKPKLPGRVSAREETPAPMTSVPPASAEDGPSRAEEDRRLLIRYHRHGDTAAREQLGQRLPPRAPRGRRSVCSAPAGRGGAGGPAATGVPTSRWTT